MPPSRGHGPLRYLHQLLKPNPNCTGFTARLQETWRFTMTLALVLDIITILVCVGIALAVHIFIHPVQMGPMLWIWAVAYPIVLLATWRCLKEPDLDPTARLYVAYGTMAIGVGVSTAAIDQAVNSPVAVVGAIGIGACWVIYPSNGWRAVMGPLSSCSALALAYVALFNWQLPGPNFELALGVSIATGVLVGAFGGMNSYHLARRDHRLRTKLREAVDDAEQAVKAKSEFLATMSHEIRTPLNGVIGMVSLLGRSKLEDDQREQLQIVERSGHALLSIINDILDFSKIEAGQLQLEEIPFDLHALAEDLIQVAEFSVGDRNVNVQLDLAVNTPRWIFGDPTRLRQVLQNLLNNSVKFTKQGTVKLKLSSAPSGESKVLLLFSVQDTGVGIAAEKQTDLFQPFSQADSSTTRNFGGTGLGLAICRRIVDQMGGTIELRSEEGVGSTFKFEIAAEVATPQQAKATGQGELTELQLPPDQKVLLVEDNNVNQRLAKAILKEMGLPFEVAGDGLEAVQVFRPERFAVILMDCSMPRMDGYQATRIIRHLEEGCLPTPIIALTANALTGDREKALKVGMDDHLSKPYTVEDLQRVLSKWLPQRGARARKIAS